MKKTLKVFAFLLVAIALMWLAFRSVDFDKLYETLKVANYWWLLFSVFFGFIAYLSRARRWMLLINPLGYKPTFLNTFNALMVGYLANLALPRVGEITRCVALGKKEKMPADQLLGTVIVERVIDTISLIIIMIVLIFTSSLEIKQFINESIINPIEQSIGSTWILWTPLILLGTTTLILMIVYRRNLRKIKFFAKLFNFLKGIVNGLTTIINLERKGEFIFHTAFIWINYFLMTWLVVFSLEATSHLTIGNSIFLLVIGGLGMAAPVQGGFGAFHYIVSRGLLVIYGIHLEDGLAYAILSHESQLFFVIITGIIAFFFIFRNKKESENG